MLHVVDLEANQETPPRTWRRLDKPIGANARPRNTSTDVEKTTSRTAAEEVTRKHLHGRGEDPRRACRAAPNSETPPRTWRRHLVACARQSVQGNTSTDVEKTPELQLATRLMQKHLHGRGEDAARSPGYRPDPETPPRKWRRRLAKGTLLAAGGNTSTDVEKT